jgi:sterol 3beta-glucosyltransferase
MRATILAPGSRGDVQPYVALGQALSAIGHRATIVTTLDHEALVRSHGLEVVTLPLDVSVELARVETNRAVEGGGVLASFRAFADIARRSSRALAEIGLEAARDADVVVTGFSAAVLGEAIATKLGRPLIQAYNVPVTASGSLPGALFPGLDLGPLSRWLGHALTRTALWQTARTSASEAAVEVLGVPRIPLLPTSRVGLVPGPLVYGLSEVLVPRPRDWPAEIEVTGAWLVEEPSTFEPPPELERFLAAGPPPVCVGFGSMSTEKPRDVSALVVEAARAARTRLVLLSGWAGLEAEQVSDEVLTIRAAPHGWLYPRCRAVVHHGGAGTTAAALSAGVPAIVAPFHGDQPFWASRVHTLGLGPRPIPRTSLTAARLSAALREASSDEAMRARAAASGARARSERGAQRAAAWIVERATKG